MTATVSVLKTAKRPTSKAKAPRAARTAPPVTSKATKFQRYQGAGYGALAAVMLGMSLEHQATGIQAATHVAAWEGWTMALAIDIGFVLTELMPFTCRAETVADTKWSRLAMAGAVLSASAWFNTVAFSYGGHVTVMSAVAGVAVPAAIGGFIHFASRCILGKAK